MVNKFIVSPDKTVKEVILYMEKEHINAVIIADKEKRLLGIFTMGDMRRFFLNNGNLTTLIIEAMNSEPKVFSSVLEAESDKNNLIIYPIVNDKGVVINVIADGKRQESSNVLKDVPVVINAGGKGTRLYPYTKILPKALIPIGEYTISERIINSFKDYGCNNFFMILNHKAEMIKSYYGDVNKDYLITFVKEKNFLGTGGGLAYLRGKVEDTFFFSNCDILINGDFECMYKTHKIEGNKITFVCAMKDMVIPYGIVETNSVGKIVTLNEKPELSFLTNTGLYIVEPEIIEELDKDEFIHMPDIAKRYIDKGEKVGVFPISESSWMDMGQFSEMESMLKHLGIPEN